MNATCETEEGNSRMMLVLTRPGSAALQNLGRKRIKQTKPKTDIAITPHFL